jgi:uncharacterized protein (DUF1778 family)
MNEISNNKTMISLRLDAPVRDMINNAAAIAGKSRTEFMVEAAREAAINIALDQQFFALDSSDHDAFITALDNPPAPGPKLRALMKRKPLWQDV